MKKFLALILAVMMVASSAVMMATSVHAEGNVITGASVTLDDGIILNFTLKEGADPADMSYWLGDKCLQDGGTSLKFSAARMADTITAIYKKGTADEETYEYSVMDYATNAHKAAHSNRVKEMLKATLNYGGAAQRFFGYAGKNVGGLDADAGCHVDYAAPEISDDYAIVATKGTVITGASATLLLADKINIVITLNGAKDLQINCAGSYEVVGDAVVVTIPVYPQNLDERYIVEAGDGTHIEYSAFTYIKNMLGKKNNAEFDALLAAIYQYNLKAEDFILSETDYWFNIDTSLIESNTTKYWKNAVHISKDVFCGIGIEANKLNPHAIDSDKTTVSFNGWVASRSDITGFKYSVDNGPLKDGIKVEAEQGVMDVANSLGVDYASRFTFSNIDLGAIDNHFVFLYATYADGTTELIWTINVYHCTYSTEGVVIVPAGCISNGIIRYYCTEEGCDKYRDESIPALGHECGADNKCIRCGEDMGDPITTVMFPNAKNLDVIQIGSTDMKKNEAEAKTNVTVAEGSFDNLYVRGWIGPKQEVVAFGYSIDNKPGVFSTEWIQEAEAPVIAAGGEYAKRMDGNIPASALSIGSHYIRFFVKLADGTIYTLWHSTVTVVPNAEREVVDLTTLETTAYKGEFAAAGYSGTILRLEYGAKIDLGAMDLSQYRYCAITYGADAAADLSGTGVKANIPCIIGLTTDGHWYGAIDTSVGAIDPGVTTLAFGRCVHSLSGWAAGERMMIIDLTAVTYNGEVFISHSQTIGNMIAISSIVFYK